MNFRELQESIQKNLKYKNSGKSISIVQENLQKAKIVIDTILREKCRKDYYIIDVSEYFNWVVIRVHPNLSDINEMEKYRKLCKDFKDFFTENNMDVNISIMLGSIEIDRFYYAITYYVL